MSLAPNYFVYVDSRKRIGGTGSDSNFSYNMNLPPDIKYNRVTVIDLLCPKSYYLIQSGYNTFQLQEDNTIVIITVPAGCYLLNSFKTQISSLLNTYSPNGWTYSMSYPASTGPDTGMWTYIVSNNFSQPSLIFNNLLFEPFGFLSGSTNTFITNSLTSTCVIKLQAEDRLILHSYLVKNPSNDDVLLSFNSTRSVNYSSITYINYAPEFTAKAIKTDNSNSAHFYLTDENGVTLDLNGLNLNFTLCFFIADDTNYIIKNFIKLLLGPEKNNYLAEGI